MDYTVPSAAELPSFETSNTQTDSPRNPLGAKGIGESGTIGSTPAIQNAVVDALSHLGVVHIDMPCTPERGGLHSTPSELRARSDQRRHRNGRRRPISVTASVANPLQFGHEELVHCVRNRTPRYGASDS